MQHRSRLPASQTSPYALAVGDQTASIDEQVSASQNKTLVQRARPPPLPPSVALAYTVNDAVQVSGLSRSSIYELIAEKKLRSILVAGRRLIPADALRELLQGAE